MQELSGSPLAFPTPTGGASLVLAFRGQRQCILILGSGLLAASRAFAALEADLSVVILSKHGLADACAEIRWRVEKEQYKIIDWDTLPSSSTSTDQQDIEKLKAFLSTTTDTISLACITDTVIGAHRRTHTSAEQLYNVFKSHKIPVNTTDIPDLCDFTFTSTHRFEDPLTGERTPLQVGVTTNGQGCRLSGRVRREILSKLPKAVGTAASKVGKLRQLAKESAESFAAASLESVEVDIASDEVNEDSGLLTPNRPVPLRSTSETALEGVRRRMKWVAQVSEYWPISKLADISEKEMREVLIGDNINTEFLQEVPNTSGSRHALDVPKRGRILLVGSGPGHPALLTIATHTALTKLADLVLSDKLVPDAVLALIPKTAQVRIARKFPGNADGAQQEMMEVAIEAAKKGLTVVRLKQGDPVVYGRAGEEVLYFRERGFEPIVVPGVSSVLAAPTFAGIPVTQRGVAESFIVCTGVGRKGKEVQLPGYERSRTLVVLMGVARLPHVIQALTEEECVEGKEGGGEERSKKREGAAYPRNTPIAIIERASMPDQRVLTSTLEHVVEALDSCGEQRPPGMMVIGWSVLALWNKGDVEVLDEGQVQKDADRVRKWLDGQGWRVQEGLDSDWDDLQ